MSKLTRCLLVGFILLLIGTLSSVNQVHASPTIYQYSPTAHVTPITATVDDPSYAYDWDNDTCADVEYNGVDGSFNMTTLTPPSGHPTGTGTIGGVIFKFTYETDTGGGNGLWRILYYVSPSSTAKVLKNWNADSITKRTVTFLSLGEPNDGTWDWTDVGNIKIVVEADKTGGGKAPHLYVYEAWVTVWPGPVTMAVDPSSIVDPTKTPGSTISIDVNITDAFDVFGFEFKLAYNSPDVVLNCTSSTVGDFLGGNIFTFVNRINNTAGFVEMAVTRGIGETEGICGSGKLATITFDVNATGSVNLDLYENILSDSFGRKTTPTTIDGYFSNVGVPEFPLGAIAEIALIPLIIYFLWKRKRKPKTIKADRTPIAPSYL